jgi:DNA-binding MarR family transcriptional regulator
LPEIHLHLKILKVQIKSPDLIDQVRAEWACEQPDLDTGPLETIGRILRAAHLADAQIRRVLRRSGLDPGTFDVLATLRRSGPPYRLTPTVLYRELVLTSGAVTHRVDALIRQGLVVRTPDPRDRRGCLVGLTEQGRAAIDQAMAAHMRCEAELAAGLAGPDREALAALLRNLLLAMDNSEAEEKASEQ